MLKNKILQYRMVKGSVAPPKSFYVTTQMEKDRHTLIEQSVNLV